MGMAFTDPPPRPSFRWRLLPKLRRWFLADDDSFVGVVSWRPSIGRYGIEWPTIRVDRLGRRERSTPVWNWARVLAPFREPQNN